MGKKESIVDQLFPEPEQPDILGGLPDFTNGEATKFFLALDPNDRDLVQWYLQQGVSPRSADKYTADLVRGYAVVDPERKSRPGIYSAHQELRRVERFISIFLESKGFFPTIERNSEPIRDEKGVIGSIKVDGWGQIASDIGALRMYQLIVEEQIAPLFPKMHAFIDSPQDAPLHFNQYEILSKARGEREAI
jgi:hypothetical protein